MFFIALTILLSCSIANYSSEHNSEFSNSSTPREITIPGSIDSSTPREIVTRATNVHRSLLYNTFHNDSNNTYVSSAEENFCTRNKNDKYMSLIKILCCCSIIVAIPAGIITIIHNKKEETT